MTQVKPFTPGLRAELEGLVVLPWTSTVDTEVPTVPPCTKKKVFVWVGGIGSVPLFYRRQGDELTRQTGIPVEYIWHGSDWLNINWLSWDQGISRFRREIDRIHREGKTIVAIIGYSLGGLQGSAVLGDLPEVKLFCIATPFQGTPLEVLQRFATWRLKFDVTNPPPHLAKMREEFAEYSDRMIIVASPFDWAAPPEVCVIKGATMIILNRETIQKMGLPFWHTVHTNIFAHPAIPRIVKAGISQPAKTNHIGAWAA